MSTQELGDIDNRALNYIRDVIRLSKKLLGDNLISIVLFGSYARGEAEAISDVDLLIVVKKKNNATKKLVNIIRKLEIKYGFTFEPKGFFGRLFYTLSQVTGIFKPAFIAEYDEIRRWNFPRIFDTSRLMTKILAPTEAVKFTILQSYKVIYGSDPFEGLKVREVSFKNILRSLVMNLVLALSSFALLPLHRETYKFIYEAMKWSMFTYAYASGKKPNINKLSKLFREPLRQGIKHFVYTRKNGKLSPGLLIYSIPSIVKIHIESIKKLKMRMYAGPNKPVFRGLDYPPKTPKFTPA